MQTKTITLYQIRRARPMGSDNLSMRLRTKARAAKLCRYLAKRYGIKTVTHAWNITPTAAEWSAIRRMIAA